MNEDKINNGLRTSRGNFKKNANSGSLALGKKRPYDVELEQAVLVAI